MDRDGLDALTMRRLGREVGVEAMSLYGHVSKKDDILDDIVDLIFVEAQLPAPGLAWDETLAQLFRNLRKLLLNHPNTVALFATHPAHSAEALRPIELSLRTLRQGGFDAGGAIDGHRVLMSFTIGYVMGEVSRLNNPDVEPNSWGTASYALLDLPGEEVPHLAELAPLALERDDDEQFARLVDIIIDGLKRHVGPARQDRIRRQRT